MQREKMIITRDNSVKSLTAPQPRSENVQFPWLLLLLPGAFVLFALVSVAPLSRLADTSLLSSLPTSSLLLLFGAALPVDLHLTANQHASQVNTDSIEFLSVMALLFLLYACAALLLSRKHILFGYRKYLILIWIGAVVVSLVYVLTPSLLSRDVFVYAGYGRIIIAHGANPYYTPLSAFPHDPLNTLDDWRKAIAAYGPLWLLVCAFSTIISGSTALHYIFFFRFLGLLLNLCNIALVTAILQKWGRSPRIVLVGTLLYAWNPLALVESNLGAHNDTAMVTCLLLGLLLTLHAEQDSFTHLPRLLAPVVAFSAAILIKFTAAPLLAFYIVLLAFRSLHPSSMHQNSIDWKRAIFNTGSACVLSGILIFTAYTPLWLGHSIKDMVASFAAPPSSWEAFGSILLALHKVNLQVHETNMLLNIFSQHSTWSLIDLLVMLTLFVTGVIWLWHVPTTRTMLTISLASLGALLIVTPWFFPWYVIWLVGLAALCVSDTMAHVEKALVAGVLAFSLSALFVYLFRDFPPVGDWIGATCLTTISPPLLIFVYTLVLLRYNRNRAGFKNHK